jgi:hypothetical protein
MASLAEESWARLAEATLDIWFYRVSSVQPPEHSNALLYVTRRVWIVFSAKW